MRPDLPSLPGVGIRRRLLFQVERFLVRGPQYRLLFIAAVIGLLSVGAGALVRSSRS